MLCMPNDGRVVLRGIHNQSLWREFKAAHRSNLSVLPYQPSLDHAIKSSSASVPSSCSPPRLYCLADHIPIFAGQLSIPLLHLLFEINFFRTCCFSSPVSSVLNWLKCVLSDGCLIPCFTVYFADKIHTSGFEDSVFWKIWGSGLVKFTSVVVEWFFFLL